MLLCRFQSRTSGGSYLFLIWIIVLLSCSETCFALESFESVRKRTRSSEGVLYDRHHRIIHEYRRDPTVRQLDWVSLKAISPALKNAVVFSEDRSFWNHHGVDWKAL